jgi:hypothetical protein
MSRLGGLAAVGTVIAGVVVAGASPAFAANPPGAPTITSAVSGPGDAQVTVSFAAPADDGGAAIDHYVVTASTGPSNTDCTSPCTVSGLTDGTSPTFTVAAHNSAGLGTSSVASAAVFVKTGQTITFPALTNQNFNATPQTLGATTDAASLTVTYTSGTTAVCTVTPTGVMTFVTAGTCTINAAQSGNATYLAATTVPRSFMIAAVAPGAPTIGAATAGPGGEQATVNFTAPALTGGSPIASYTATSSGGIPKTGTCTASPCVVSGLTDGFSYSFTVTATNGASLTGPASAASNSVIPEPGQTITFNNPGTQTFGTTPTLTATSTGTSGHPITFTSTTTPVCTVTTTGTLTFVTVGTCTIKADQAGDATHLAAPTVTQTFTVQKATPTVTVTVPSGSNPGVTGQPLTFTATLTNPVSTGQIQWSVNGTNVGSAVTLSATGTATFTPSPALTAGSYVVKATYAGDANHNTNSGQLTEVVGKATTKTAVGVSGNTLTASVSVVAPGAGSPTGTVTFTVGGLTVGSAPVTGGVATLNGSNVGNQGVAATYSGDANFLASSGNRTPIAPTVVGHVSSAHPKLRGWYRSPVTVSFTCTANTAPVVSCPAPVTLTKNQFGQSVTETVRATDGGTTTVSVSRINIDRVAPKLTVHRSGRALACDAVDGLSGLQSCRITRRVHMHPNQGINTVNWTAVATDRAGNTRTKHGKFSYLTR